MNWKVTTGIGHSKKHPKFFDVMTNIIEISKKENKTTDIAAREIAIKRVESVSNSKKIRIYRDKNLFNMRNI